MSKARAALIQAMHASNGCQVKSCTEWLSAAQTFDALGAAFRKVYGKKLPSVQKLGKDLTLWAGKAYGDLRLISIYNTDVKAARYAVETEAESQLRETKEWDKAESEQIIRAEKEQRAIGRALKKAFEKEAKEREAAELAQVATMTIEVVKPVEYETTTRVTGDGRIITTPVMGRNGEPIKKHPTTAPAAKPAEPEPTLPPSKRGTEFPLWIREGRNATREEWQAHQVARCGGPHRQEEGPSSYRDGGSELAASIPTDGRPWSQKLLEPGVFKP